MKKTREKDITDITNISLFNSLVNDSKQCDHKENSYIGSVIPGLPIHPELEALVDNFLLNYLQNTGLIVCNISDNISIIHPEPKYSEIIHDFDSYSSYLNLDNDDSESEENKIKTWLSKVELPSREEGTHFANMNQGKSKKKHNK